MKKTSNNINGRKLLNQHYGTVHFERFDFWGQLLTSGPPLEHFNMCNDILHERAGPNKCQLGFVSSKNFKKLTEIDEISIFSFTAFFNFYN